MKAVRLRPHELPDDARSRLNQHSILTSDRFLHLWKKQGGEPVCWTGEQDGALVAVLPGVEFGVSPVRRWQAMPNGLAAHVVPLESPFADPSRLRVVADTLVAGVREHRYVKSTLNDYHREVNPLDDWDVRSCEVEVINPSADDWEPCDKKLLSEIRKADREGVEVRAVDPAADFDQILRLVKSTEARHPGTVKYEKGFFRELAELSAVDDRVQWRLAVKDGEIAASQIFLIDHHTALYWHAHSEKKLSHLKATQYLLFCTARLLGEMGVKSLNLGASPPDASGLQRFKEKWGGVPYQYPVYESRSLLGKVL